MKSDIPDDLFVFPDSPSFGPNCSLLSSEADSFFFSSSIGEPNRPDSLTPNLFLLSSEADSVFYTDISPPDHFVDVNEKVQLDFDPDCCKREDYF